MPNDLNRSTGVPESLLCNGGLKASKICWKRTQIIEDMGRIREKVPRLGAETIHLTFRCRIEASFELLQRRANGSVSMNILENFAKRHTSAAFPIAH